MNLGSVLMNWSTGRAPHKIYDACGMYSANSNVNIHRPRIRSSFSIAAVNKYVHRSMVLHAGNHTYPIVYPLCWYTLHNMQKEESTSPTCRRTHRHPVDWFITNDRDIIVWAYVHNFYEGRNNICWRLWIDTSVPFNIHNAMTAYALIAQISA